MASEIMVKYNLAAEYVNKANGMTERVEVTGCDSVDDAGKYLKIALRDRFIAIEASIPQPPQLPLPPANIGPAEKPITVLPDMVKTYADRDMDHEVQNNIPTTTNSNKQPA